MNELFRNHLPHITPLGGCFFITFCTHDSIPIHKNIDQSKGHILEEFRRHHFRYDKFETSIDISITSIAEIIKEKLHKMDNEYYELLYYCIMKNHVHFVINTGFIENPVILSKIMKLLKGSTSREINLSMNRTGTLWQKDSYDHLIRSDQELGMIGDYILKNPVKAGLVTHWEDWPNTYVKYN